VDYRHFVLTPFFVRRQMGGEKTRPLPPAAWLAERLAIFEARCLPTIVNQTSQDFDWLLFFDPETPEAEMETFKALIAPYPNVHLRFCNDWVKQTITDAVRTEAGPDLKWVLTTRLDNDDGWHEQFVERLHAEVRVGTRELLNFTRGYIISDDKAYSYEHRSNAFISFSEPIESFDTPFAISHELLATLAPIRQIDTTPSFYQFVHGDNVSNKVRGTRVPIETALAGFANMRYGLPDRKPETRLGIAIENATLGLMRNGRDTLINIYKRAAGRTASTT
jgi:hypothetical protein